MRKNQLVDGCYYHVFNRGVNHTPIFLDAKDFLRFYYSMYLFNDVHYRHEGGDPIIRDVLLASHKVHDDERQEFVKIIAYCLLPNHFHFFLQQTYENGISRFLQKVSKGFAQYHNIRHERSGPLFDGRFKATLIDREAYFNHLPRYIHLNALDTTGIDWRDGEVTDWSSASKHLGSYRWSSHSVYMGEPQDLPVVDMETVHKLFPNVNDYITFIRTWSSRYSLPYDVP